MFNLIGQAKALSRSSLSPLKPLETGISLGDMILRIVNWFLIAAGALAVIYLIYGGILYITAGGDAEKATKGRTAVINAIIGIVIILLSVIIVTWVNTLVKNNG